MTKKLRKYSVKIPENIKIIYSYDRNFILLMGPLGNKILKLKLKILLQQSENLLFVTNMSNIVFSGKQKKLLNNLQGTVVALLKQSILEISIMLHKKLELIGVGYKVFLIENYVNLLLHFKLGFSHSIYFKISSEIKVLPFKSTNLYIFGNSYSQINQLAFMIWSYKYPEPYKGKGILCCNEKIQLKEGKKI